MASICSIIPEHLLKTIIERGNAPSDVVTKCQSTLDQNNRLRTARIEHGQQISPAPHELAQDSAGAQARPNGRHLDRTVYDAQHRESLSRDKILIKEGGALISKIKDPSEDANECYIGFEKTYDFYLKHFSRDSLNNKGLALDGIVHYGIDFENAFFDGKEMVFGDGSNVFNGFTDELDVIGHELTHGVVDYTCKLKYWFQSGALNESLADVFGIMIKQWGEDLDKPQTAAEANWLIGEGIWRQGINGRALRDMKNPGTAFDDPMTGKDPQPAHWKDFVVLPNTEEGDFGGVHINSGIPNRAFALASTKIGGFAWEGAGQIWYKAMTSGKLKETATFKEFADATIKNAGGYATDVQEAWEEVGYPF